MQVTFEDARPRFFGNGATGSRRLMTEFAEGMEKEAKPLGVSGAYFISRFWWGNKEDE
jgi:hypothetical protein